MLEGLQNINWQQLKHAYGPATDVPDNLRDLASPNREVREEARYKLYGNIFHQGSRYEATPYAIPFIYELIHSPRVLRKDQLVLLLLHLALGYEEEYLPEGVNPKAFRDELLLFDQSLTEEQRRKYANFGHSSAALINCYDVVRDGLPTLLPYLHQDDEPLKDAVVYVLAWFPELAATTLPAIVEVLKKATGELEIAGAILSIGLMTRRSSQDEYQTALHPYLEHTSKLIRTCATIALAQTPLSEEIAQALIEGIASGQEFKHVKGLRFNEGRISGYVSMTLAEYGKSSKHQVLPALCLSLQGTTPYQSLDVTRAILSFFNSKRLQPITEVIVEELVTWEIDVLKAIYYHGGWGSEGSVFVDYARLLASHGLPDTKVALGKFLRID